MFLISVSTLPKEEFGSCPHCGSSWRNTPHGEISLGAWGGVLICRTCLHKPQKLNVARIIAALQKVSGWSKDQLQMVQTAVTRHKELKH